MHNALRIPEIVHLVVSELNTEGRELVALARTCTRFQNIALDALWRKQTNVVNLIRCMPEDLWETVDVVGIPTLKPRRSTVAADWDRVSVYAHRIRFLICRDPYNPTYLGPELIHVYETLRKGLPGRRILPNLNCLWWHHFPAAYAPFVSLFLGPQITSINVGPQADSDCAMLSALGQSYPDLVFVVIKGGETFLEDPQLGQLYTVVRSLTRVEYLDVEDRLDSETLRHLGLLTSLRTLHIRLPPLLAFPGIADGSLFSDLCVASVSGKISASIALLRTWNNPPVQTFTASLSVPPGMQHVEDLYRALAAHCMHDHLEVLHVGMFLTDLTQTHAGNFFRPLFSFTHLTILRMYVPGGYDLDDTIISDLSHAWPNIRELVFESYSEHRPRCTLLGLYFLSQRCPSLRILEITLDASNVPPLPANVTEHILQDSLISFNVAFSPISEASSVAQFLSSIFSKLVAVSGCPDWREVEVGQGHYERWKNVDQILRARRTEV
ncbi:hypothetical protein MVEN_01469900 [Mycena venus]|uniref:F-box domain-containing protein n=1 Tax=Mycena venus TaxID=2733690 RepID=A0A8H7CR43_9AGAR|nr:hypothetical protein MVEN_01469900 [Mycena venus]